MFSTYRIALPILLLLFASSFNSRRLHAQLVKRSDLKQYSLYGEEKWGGLVNIGKGIQLKAKIDVTRRGNGGLIIANLDLKVHDSNPALGLYEDSLCISTCRILMRMATVISSSPVGFCITTNKETKSSRRKTSFSYICSTRKRNSSKGAIKKQVSI